MTSFRNYVFRRTAFLGLIFLTFIVIINYMSTQTVKEAYRRNLVYLSILLERNLQFLLELSRDRALIEVQLSRAVSKIPEIEAIYVQFDGKVYAYPEKFLPLFKSFCRLKPLKEEAFEYGEYLVVCLPLKEEYASEFVQSEQKGVFVVLFNRKKENEFLAKWVSVILLFAFSFVGIGLTVILSIWLSVNENFLRLERLIALVRSALSKDGVKVGEGEVLKLINSFSLREFRDVGSLIFKLMREVKLLNEQIQRLAITDPLTTLYNRNYLELFVKDKLFSLWNRKRFPIAVAILDLDDFKQINDTFGHQKGDEVLRKWASIIKGVLRSSDIPIRFGGEEILIIFPHTKKEDAVKAVERIRRRVFSEDFGVGRKVTFSAGVSGYPEDGEGISSLDDLIRIADERLYKAKKSGKNRVISN